MSKVIINLQRRTQEISLPLFAFQFNFYSESDELLKSIFYPFFTYFILDLFSTLSYSLGSIEINSEQIVTTAIHLRCLSQTYEGRKRQT